MATEHRATYQTLVVSFGAALVAAVSVALLTLNPPVRADTPRLRGAVNSAPQVRGDLPVNDDFRFRPISYFQGSGKPPVTCDVAPLFDTAIAIDRDVSVSSNYPDNEGPGNVVDQDSNTKYLNFGREDTGFIVTPLSGASTIQSIQFTTANDSSERDPLTFDLYGTNDAITSADNSAGANESWTLITSGATGLPEARFAAGPVIDFANGASYTSYKVIFPTVRGNGNSMQIADVALYTGAGGTGAQVLAFGDPVLAVADLAGESAYPNGEGPDKAIDGTLAKYLNFGGSNSGLILSRADGQAVVVEAIGLTSADDATGRDPTSYAIWGTNDPVTSQDNSTGNDENWTFIQSGGILVPIDRNTAGPLVAINNTTAYTAYRIVFPTLRTPGDPIMQIAEISFCGSVERCPCELNGADPVDVFDLLAYLNLWFSGDAAADIDGIPGVDVFDLLAFLECWFPASAGACP